MDKASIFNNRLSWGLSLLAIPVVAALLYLAFWFFIGLSIAAAAGGALLGASILIALRPAISEKLTQLKYSAFKAVVASDPTGSLEIEVARGKKHLDRAWEALQEKKTIVEDFRLEVEKVRKEAPEDVAEAEEQLRDGESQMAFGLQEWLAAEQIHLEFVKEVARKKRRWRLAVAGAKMRKALAIEKDFMSELRRDTAFAAIQQKHAENIAHMKLSRDVEYMRKRMAEAKEAPKALVFDTQGHVVLPQTQKIDYAEVLTTQGAPA